MRRIRLAAALFLAPIGVPLAAQQAPARDSLPEVTVTGPAVVAFWIVPASDSVLEADPGLASALDDQQYYWAERGSPLSAAGITPLDQPGRRFRVREADGRVWEFAADPDSAAIGYLLLRSGSAPQTLYGRRFPDELLAAMRGPDTTAVPANVEEP